MTTLVNVTDNSFDPEVLKCDIPVLANFGAEWAAPSQNLLPVLQEIATEHSAQVKVVNVDIESNPAVTAVRNVLSVPTLILFKNAQEVVRLEGSRDKQGILNAINPYFDQ
ncbi:MAG: Thioredoxin [Anaerolineae bacterium]|nr:Thioredoxin [Anaerolineae bacterium]